MAYERTLKPTNAKKTVRNSKIDVSELERLSKLHLTTVEIANWFGCSRALLECEPFVAIIDKGRAETKQRLKQKALQRALVEDSDVMLKFCLKNYCGWTDVPTMNVSPDSTVNNTGFTVSFINNNLTDPDD